MDGKPVSQDPAREEGPAAPDNLDATATVRLRPVGLRDVAALARVSAATASRALNGDKTVDRLLRDRVLTAARRLNYRPNPLARHLRRQRTSAIGVVVSAIDNPHFSEMVRAVEDEAYRHGHRVLVCNTDEDPSKQAAYLRVLADERVGGVIISPSDPSGIEIGELLDASIPVVAFDRAVADPRADAVVGDNVASVREATELLIRLGHRRIACVSGWHSVGPSAERQLGYTAAMTGAGLEPVTVETNSRIDGGRKAVADLLRGPAGPTALIVANNLMTVGALEAARDGGFRIPQDVAIIGVDDPFWAPFTAPPLTTIAQPVREMAVSAMDLLMELMSGDRTEPRRVVHRFELRWRESAGPMPAQSGTAPGAGTPGNVAS